MDSEKIETPYWDSCLSEEVYEPSEDTFLLFDALERELPYIRSQNPTLVLEIGSGSGVVIAAIAKYIKNIHCIAVDINPHACLATEDTACLNNVEDHISVINCDLTDSLKLDKHIDLLIFNPPYVPTCDLEVSGTIQRSWAGGTNGRLVLDRLVEQLPNIMSDNSLGYFVLIEENHPSQLAETLNNIGFNSEIILKRQIPGEKLSILRFNRKN